MLLLFDYEIITLIGFKLYCNHINKANINCTKLNIVFRMTSLVVLVIFE